MDELEIKKNEQGSQEAQAQNQDDDLQNEIETELGEFKMPAEERSFLPEGEDESHASAEEAQRNNDEIKDSELASFESAAIEELEFVEEQQLQSILESILFASDRPVSLHSIKQVFKGTNISGDHIRRSLEQLAIEYAGGNRGITLEEVPGGYQLRTKLDNLKFLKRTLKARTFKLSGPALEVLAIVAYKKKLIKSDIDHIRGVESGHLLRALMEKGLCTFDGKSELPGRPMYYTTTKKFLEIFGLRNLNELPSLSQINELIPDGIGDEDEAQKETLSDVTSNMATSTESVSYSAGEEELLKINETLSEISTSSDFFEQEKIRQKKKRDEEKAQNLREALVVGEPVSTRDLNWLKKYDEAIATGNLDALYAPKTEAKASVAQVPEGESQNPSESIDQVELSEVEDGDEALTPDEQAIIDFELDQDHPKQVD